MPRGSALTRILILAGLLRLIVLAWAWWNIGGAEWSDDYLGQGAHLQAEGSRRDPVYAPLYSLLIAGGLAVFSEPGLILALFLGQSVLGVVNVWLVAAIARELSPNPKVPLAAAALQAVNPLALAIGPQVLTEPLYLTAMLGAALLALRAASAARPSAALRWALACGAVLAIAQAQRSIGLIAVIACCGALLLAPQPLALRLRTALVCLAAALLPLLPWQIANWQKYGAFAVTSSSHYNVAVFLGAARSRQLGRAPEGNLEVWREELAARKIDTAQPFRLASGAAEIATAWAAQQPAVVIKGWAVALAINLSSPWGAGWSRIAGWPQDSPRFLALKGVVTLWRLAVLALAAAAVHHILRRRWPIGQPIAAGLTIALALGHLAAVGPMTDARLVMPMLPLMDCLAAVALAHLLPRQEAS